MATGTQGEFVAVVNDTDPKSNGKAYSLKISGNNYSQICGLFREMAVQSYKSTEFVLTSKLAYVPIPGRYNGNVDV